MGKRWLIGEGEGQLSNVWVRMSMRTFASHLMTILAIGGFAVLGVASSGSGDGDQSEEAESNSAGSGARRTLEGHLSNGSAYGEGPGGPEIAHAMEELLDTAMGDAVAVHVTPGTPEQVVVILRLRDLREMDDATRQEWLDSFGNTVRETFGATDANIVVGIRGNVFFGAVATMSPTATSWDTRTGAVVSTGPIDDALAIAASPSQEGQVPQDVYASIASSDAIYTPPAEEDGFEDARAADRYTLELAAGTAITARMHSPEIDSYLYVLSPDGSVLVENDDSDEFLNARVDFTAAAAGTYTIVATTYSTEDFGPYALRIRPNGGTP